MEHPSRELEADIVRFNNKESGAHRLNDGRLYEIFTYPG